jgi:hypothetical protein
MADGRDRPPAEAPIAAWLLVAGYVAVGAVLALVAVGAVVGSVGGWIGPWWWRPPVGVAGAVVGWCARRWWRAASPAARLPSGYERLTEEEHPALWAAVRAAAGEAGLRPPGAMILTGGTGVRALPPPTWLGLRRRPVELHLGLALVGTVRTDQLLGAVVAELARDGGPRVGPDAAICRIRDAAIAASAGRRSTTGLAAVWLDAIVERATPAARSAEARRHVVAARTVGPDAMAELHRRAPAITHGYRAFWDRQVAALLQLGLAPRDAYEGFVRFLETPDRDLGVDLDAASHEAPTRRHELLTAAERARLATRAPRYATPDATPARRLLHDVEALQAWFTAARIGPGGRHLTFVEWTQAGGALCVPAAQPLVEALLAATGAPTAADAVARVEALSDDERIDLAVALRPAIDRHDRHDRGDADDPVLVCLAAALAWSLVAQGTHRWSPPWRGRLGLEDHHGERLDVERLARLLVQRGPWAEEARRRLVAAQRAVSPS